MKEKIECVFPKENSKFKLICQVGLINKQFYDVSFQLIYKNNKLVPGTFNLEPWGFSTNYNEEDKMELEKVLDDFTQFLSHTYNITFADKPENNLENVDIQI